MSKLKTIREQKNLTQEELASKSGISARTIQRIESGTTPKGYTLKTLAAALEIAPEVLLNEESLEENIIDMYLAKLINLSSLLLVFLPLGSVLVPLAIMYFSKQFNALTKQIVSLQILWTIVSAILIVLSGIVKKWLNWENNVTMVIIVLVLLTNIYIILRNTAEIDKKEKLHIRLKFSII